MVPTEPGERERIREALLDLCLERGYAGTTEAMLLARAEIDQVGFNRHFESLEDCFCQVYVEIRDWALDLIGTAVAGQTTWRTRLRAAAYGLLRAFNHDERNTHLAMVDVRFAGERALILMAEGMGEMFDLIDEGREIADGGSGISRATAESIGGSIFNQVFVALNREFPLAEGVVPQLMYTAVLPYLGAEAAKEELTIPAPPG
jgi:AcrR family transcriptional regulator